MTISGLDQVYLAFEIHDVLAQQSASIIEAPLFQAQGMLLHVPVEDCPLPIRFYVYPFVKELFQLLAATPCVHIAFIASTHEIILKPLVKHLLMECLGQEKYAQIADRVNICAKEQLKGNNTDLDVVFPGVDIPKRQRLFIDDINVTTPDQLKNHVFTSGWCWADRLQNYQNRGFTIYFYRSYEEFEINQSMVKPAKSIAFFGKPIKDGVIFVIVYHDKDGRKELELSLEESAHIKALWDKMILERTVFLSEKPSYRQDEKTLLEEMKKTGVLDSLKSNKSKLILISGPGVSSETCWHTALEGNLTFHLTDGEVTTYLPKSAQDLKGLGGAVLRDLLRNYWSSKCMADQFLEKNSDETAAKTQLYDYVWDKVKDLVWKERMIFQANHILLLTGAIFSAWEESKATRKPISKVLFKWQCKKDEQSNRFLFGMLHKRADLYLKGLELLRKMNSEIVPITIKSYEEASLKYYELPDDGSLELDEESFFS